MSTDLFYDSDDERDSFDVERRQIEKFRRHLLFASSESSSDDEEGIIDGSKVPSSSKTRSRARKTFLDISILSSSSSVNSIEENDENPFEIISKSINVEKTKKRSKTLGIAKSRLVPENIDIYDQEETNNEQEKKVKNKPRKPTKTDVLETERKMQQLARSEQLILPKFVPKPLESFHALGKRLRNEPNNENREKDSSSNNEIIETKENEKSQSEPTVSSTLEDLTKLIEEKVPSKIDRLSRFLNAEILNKKPKLLTEKTETIDLSETKKSTNVPTVKSDISALFETAKSPQSNKKLSIMQKELDRRMKEKRAATLAENAANLSIEDEEILDDEQTPDNSTDESEQDECEMMSTGDNENEIFPVDEETKEFSSEEENEFDQEETTNPAPADPNRPSLKTILTRMESMEPMTSRDENGQTEWFAADGPATVDENLEFLCSGAFGGDNAIPLSQNKTQREPLPFSPLPETQRDDFDDEDFQQENSKRNKVRKIIDEDEPISSADQQNQEEQENDDDDDDDDEQEDDDEPQDNEELLDYKKQWFEMEAEESGSENEEKKVDDDDENDEDEEADEELAKFIDTAAEEIDEEEADNLAKVHLKLKAKEDEQRLKLLKEQYLEFDGDDDGRKIQIGKGRIDDDEDDDPSYNTDAEDEQEEEEEEEDPLDLKNHFNEIERQRSIQDNQAEEVHLDEDLEHIGQNSSMFKKGLELKQRKNPTKSEPMKNNASKTVTLSSVLLAQRFSSTLLATSNKNNVVLPHNSTTDAAEKQITNKKQLNPRRHVFGPNENLNPTAPSGEKRASSAEKSPSTKIKRFKQSSGATTTNSKPVESSSSVFSALALSTFRR